MKTLEGRLQLSGRGFGFVIPIEPEEPDVFVPRESIQDAMHGDQVIVRLLERSATAGRKAEGQIIKVLRRANTHIVGSFSVKAGTSRVQPSDVKISTEILIPKKATNGAHSGDQVIVEITRWPQQGGPAEGKVAEILGRAGDPGVDVLTVIAAHQLPRDFPAAVEQAAERVPAVILPAELTGRRDLRALATVTIDSEDAKDLDDAVHVERLGPDSYRLGVHIADVSHYVRENSPLDMEARLRGTSVYLVDRVIPMLPHRLSNGICSLNHGEDRLTLSASMDIDGSGRVTHYEIFPSVIRVNTRLSYKIVRRILADKDAELREQYAALVPMLETMEQLADALREKRKRRGAIDFDLPEIKVILDDQGHTTGLEKRMRTVAESIIEEFMLAANETVAEHMDRREIPFVYRVHADPDPEKMAKLADLLRSFGQHIGAWTEVKPMDLQKALAWMEGRPEEKMVSTLMLRSLKQARYEAENAGHFGLAAKYYTHFTSPIRRYPDLIVHRLLHETLSGPLSAERREQLTQLLPKIASDASDRERAATEAERESVDMKTAEYMAQFIGDEFPATIAGVTAFGFFVELENSVEGLVHVSSLDDDYYQYMEDQHCLIGERLKKRYRLGDAVTVRLISANPANRTIDFTLASSPVNRQPRRTGATPAKSSSRKPALPQKSAKRKKPEVKTSVGKTQKHKDRRRKP
ncbi:MAG TPA: ribonuclease R [Negativicutes bacterium]|nr:ribonuclease R [Negativicutes bacterium]